MGLIARATGTLEVLAAEPFSISLDPTARSIRQNDAVQAVSYRVLFDRTGGFLGPVYLRVVNIAGSESFSVNPIPEGQSESLLTIDTSGWQVTDGPFAFEVEAYSDPADYPEGWPPPVEG